MTYRQIRAYLDSFINYEKRSAFPYRRSLKLERMRALLAQLGDPQKDLKAIHVAGTKGKGSVCALCASILNAAGYRVGLYTSPHLCDPRERIRVLDRGGVSFSDFSGMISREAFTGLVERLKPAVEKFHKSSVWGKITFFEFYTACAFVFFRDRRVDFAVIETGLGGRLDATNTIEPMVFGVTSVGLDHTATLGSTIRQIAREKAGIIKPGGWLGRPRACVSAAVLPEAADVIRKRCRETGVRLFEVGRDIRVRRLCFDRTGQSLEVRGWFGGIGNLRISLPGPHQLVNAATAVGLVKSLERVEDIRVPENAFGTGFARARWPARCEIISSSPVIVLDGAHNPDSARALVETVRELFPSGRITTILGISRDKDASRICSYLSGLSSRFFVTRASNRRALSPGIIAGFLKGSDVRVRTTVGEALRDALREVSPDEILLITGSIFVAGEARRALKRQTGRKRAEGAIRI